MASQHRMEEAGNPRPQFVELTRDDVAPLIAESEHAFLPAAVSPQATTSDLLAQFADDPCFSIHWYVIDGQPATYVITLSHEKSETLTIGPMYVGAGIRGRGLGRLQVEDFIAHAKALGYGSIYTKTWGNNTRSRRIFDDLGFRMVSIKASDRVNGDSTIHYWLDIND